MTTAIPVGQVYPNRQNVRDDLGDLTELAASIKARGIQQPLVVTKRVGGGFTIVDGHRRFAAAMKAGATVVPCIAARVETTSHQVAVMLAAAMHKELTPLEQAKAFGRLADQGQDAKLIAEQTGYTVRTVRDRLALLALPADAVAMLEKNELTLAAATDLGRALRSSGSGSATVRVRKTGWFTKSHPQAKKARERCDHKETRVLVAGVACGECWEVTIRAAAMQQLADAITAEFGDTPVVQAARRRAIEEETL